VHCALSETDFSELGGDGTFFHDDPEALETWYAFESPLPAVANGVVIDTKEGVDDTPAFHR
jgi:hypothetical protein